MTGKMLGHYQIGEKIGEGGMGVVYKARDTHLDRFVAVKLLPENRTADPDRRRRFIQEAKAASALNHPHIMVVHDINSENGSDFLVTEYVQGKTLDQLIPRKGMRLSEALKYAIQIADGLAAAHAAGIIHRDVKPSNVIVSDFGHVKILDFGLAKLREGLIPGTSMPADEETQAATRTAEGQIVGTVSYMSPEQAQGQKVDERSDIFSFGSLFYEMLTGNRAFAGESNLSTLSSIVEKEPNPLPADLPREIQRVVNRCLRKDPARRFQSMADVRVELQELKEDSDSGRLPALDSAVSAKRRPRWLWPALAGFLLLAGTAAYWLRPGYPPPGITGYTQMTNDGHQKGRPFTDGTRLYFDMVEGNRRRIYQMPITGGEIVPVSTPFENCVLLDVSARLGQMMVGVPTAGATTLIPYTIPTTGGTPLQLGDRPVNQGVWSPAGDRLAFTIGNELYLAGLDGSNPKKLASLASTLYNLTWSPDGRRLRFSEPPSHSGAFQVLEVTVADGKMQRFLPHLPDGIIPVYGQWTRNETYFLFDTIDKNDREFGLWAIREKYNFWHSKRNEPVRLMEGNVNLFGSSSSDGHTLYFLVRPKARPQLVHLDTHSGLWVPTLGGIAAKNADYSRDGRWVVYVDVPGGHLWKSRSDGTEAVQLTFSPLQVALPRFSPDSNTVALMARQRDSHWRIYTISAQGGIAKQLLRSDREEMDPNFSPDGRRIVFAMLKRNPNTQAVEESDIRVLDLNSGRMEKLPGSEGMVSTRWSPDGRYIVGLTNPNPIYRLKIYDTNLHQWKSVPADGSVAYPAFTRDSKWVYFAEGGGNVAAVDRVRLSDGVAEQVPIPKDTEAIGGPLGAWFALDDTDSPMITLDAVGNPEIHAIHWDEP